MEKITYSFRNFLGLSVDDLSDFEMAKVFKVTSKGRDTINFMRFESFLAFNSDKVSSHFVFVWLRPCFLSLIIGALPYVL